MIHHRIARRELFQAQLALFMAIALQLLVWKINHQLLVGPQYLIIPAEVLFVLLLGFTVNHLTAVKQRLHHGLTLLLVALLSAANLSSLIMVLHSLIIGHSAMTGTELLTSAMAIFATNIIVFSLWYWEIDSPGLSRTRWSVHDQGFQFTQQDTKALKDWQPEYIDYLYLSLTNAINFAPADARPITHQAKILMGSQALVSVFTLALVLARSVSILGA